MAYAQDPRQPWTYYLPEDRELVTDEDDDGGKRVKLGPPKPDATTFELRTLTQAQSDALIAYLCGRGDVEDIDPQKLLRHMGEIVQFGLLGWTNYPKPDGDEAPFATSQATFPWWKKPLDAPTKETLDHIPVKHRQALTMAILKGPEHDPDDQKNS